MGHPSEEVLARYALDPSLVPDVPSIERHLAECNECRRRLSEVSLFDAALADQETWTNVDDHTEKSDNDLRAFAERIAHETAEATRLLAEFETAPAARFVWANLPARVPFRTAGVVLLLNERANAMCDRDPRYALAIAETATAIALQLSEDNYPMTALHEWRGCAWKEQANAFYSLGQFPEALNALTRAEREYDSLSHAGLGIVGVLYVRALVSYEQEDFAAAEELAELSARAARHLGATDRYMSARTLRGNIAFRAGDYARALTVFDEALKHGESSNSTLWIARESLNIGLCHLEMRSLREARRSLDIALRHFAALALEAERTRTKWALARLTFAEGQTDVGIRHLTDVVDDLLRRGMLTDAAVAAVHLAEMLASTGRSREVARILDGVVRTFTRAGKLTGALSALAYLKEATAAGAVTPTTASQVRAFLRRVDRRPELIFLPPDDPV